MIIIFIKFQGSFENILVNFVIYNLAFTVHENSFKKERYIAHFLFSVTNESLSLIKILSCKKCN